MSNMEHIEWLNSIYAEGYEKLKQFVKDVWEEKGDALKFTPHDSDHSQRVENMIKWLVPPEKWMVLSEKERKILTWCAWTHDVGMFTSIHSDNPTEEEMRSKHVDKSAEWVLKNKKALALSQIEAQVVSYIIRFHSRKYKINECDERRQCDGEWIRTRLLGAYLRLADAIDVCHARVEEHQNVRFQLLHRLISGDREVTLFHWIKSFLVSGIIPNHKKQVFEIEFQLPKGYDFNEFTPLIQFVVNELKGELETVEGILDSGGISSFHDVIEFRTELVLQSGDNELWIKSLPEVFIYLQIASSPSSSSMTGAVLASLKDTIEKEEDKRNLQEKLNQFHTSLLYKIERRPGHSQLRYICQSLDLALKNIIDCSDKNGHVKIKADLQDFINGFGNLFKDENSISENLRNVLKELCGENKRASWTFLLYGSSKTIANALGKLDIDLPITLLIAEARTKTIHGSYNTPTYLDAESYLSMIRSKESKKRKAKVIIIPDAIIATAIKLGIEKKCEFNHIDAVLLGTNGLFLKPSICASDTAGALGVTLIAKSLNVPVIKVLNASKIWDKFESDWKKQQRPNDNKWLTSHQKLRERLCEKNQLSAEIDWNPREDYIPIKNFSAIVTNYGVLSPEAGDAENQKQLEEWHNKVLVDSHLKVE